MTPSGEPSTLQVFEQKESMEDQGDCFILDSDEEEGWLQMATLLHLGVHVDDTMGVGNMSPNEFLLHEDCKLCWLFFMHRFLGFLSRARVELTGGECMG